MPLSGFPKAQRQEFVTAVGNDLRAAQSTAGVIDPSFIITHRCALADAPAAYKTFRDKKEDCIKVVIEPYTDCSLSDRGTRHAFPSIRNRDLNWRFQMVDTTATIKKTVEQVAETSKQLADSARHVANNAAELSKGVVRGLSERASDAASYLEQQGENVTDAVSGGLKSTARSIRELGPQEGTMRDATYGVAQQFSNAAGYLDQQGFEGMLGDVSSLVKQSPLAAFAIGIGVGYVIGLATQPRA